MAHSKGIRIPATLGMVAVAGINLISCFPQPTEDCYCISIFSKITKDVSAEMSFTIHLSNKKLVEWVIPVTYRLIPNISHRSVCVLSHHQDRIKQRCFLLIVTNDSELKMPHLLYDLDHGPNQSQ